MIQTIKNPYYSTARTAEIMSKYRPIAPKPPADHAGNTATEPKSYGVINKSPYLRNVWAHLQARPSRTRKRGRTAGFAPASVKRARANCGAMQGIVSTTPFAAVPKLVQLKCGLGATVATLSVSTAVVPILCCNDGVDLNIHQVPRELDFLGQLSVKPGVISPRPVRPVGSSVVVKDVTDVAAGRCNMVVERTEEMEKVVEEEKVPVIVSDSKNRVRMTNSAYKEMVGQPECGWLDCAGGGRGRIGGEVLLRFVDSKAVSRDGGFSCGVAIEWESDGEKRSVGACCDVVKLVCVAKDYQFLWRFRVSD